MASLMDELLETMEEEKAGYDALIALTDDKRESIVHNKLELLEQVTSREEEITSGLKNLENRRLKVLKDMAVVLGHDGEDMTVTHLIALLKEQPKEQAALIKARDTRNLQANAFYERSDSDSAGTGHGMVDFDLTLLAA